MPIIVDATTRRMSQSEFREVAYRVMQRIFHVHNELGRLFHEPVYQKAISIGLNHAQTEVQIDVIFENFRKEYFMDLLVEDGAVFELKSVQKLSQRHRAQLLNYLLLAELPHGKLVNIRPELVEHEFVNTSLTRADRICFTVDDANWKERSTQMHPLKELLVSILRDWGTGLELPLYTEAITHFLGGESVVLKQVNLTFEGRSMGHQPMHLAAPDTAFHITQIVDAEQSNRFENHARRLLIHSELSCLHWINVTRKHVAFRSIERRAVH